MVLASSEMLGAQTVNKELLPLTMNLGVGCDVVQER